MNYVEPIRDINLVKQIEKDLNPKYSLIWAIGTQIGLRVSDILNLKTDIVNKQFVTVREQKTGKLKKFPINEKLQNKIRYYIEKYRNQLLHCDKSDWLFIGNREGKQLDRSVVYRNFNEIAARLGIIENIGTHTMRKTFGYHHYKQFHDVALLQVILNHSDPQITLRYIGITQDEVNNSYKSFCLNSETMRLHEQAVELRRARNNFRTAKYQDKKYFKELIKECFKEISDEFYLGKVKSKINIEEEKEKLRNKETKLIAREMELNKKIEQIEKTKNIMAIYEKSKGKDDLVVADLLETIESLQSEIKHYKHQIRNLQSVKYEDRKTQKNSTTFEGEVTNIIKNYIKNGGVKYKSFCEQVLCNAEIEVQNG